MKKLLQIFLLLLISSSSYAGGGGGPTTAPPACAQSNAFCTGTSYSFQNSTNVADLGGGGIYRCLDETPNAVWYHMQIGGSGTLKINISQVSNTGTPIDVDFCLWGPFTSVASGCSSLSSSNVVDCSYSNAATETATINNAQAGQFYILVLTNYDNISGTISFGQSNIGQPGAATTNCNILCNMQNLTATPGACVPATGQYAVTGQITVQYPPTTGTLTVSSSCGTSVTIPGPWVSPINYTMPGLTANGAACTLTAVFSADPTCTLTRPFTAPAACLACTVTAGNNGPVCSGGTVNLTATTVAGATGYAWTGPGGYTSNVQNPSITNITTGGTYTVTVTSAGGQTCTSNTTVVVNATPTATAGSNSPVCSGGTLNLTGNTVAGATYSWTGPGGFTSNLQNPTVANVTAGGTYTLTVTSGTCPSTPSSVTVVVNPTPTATAGSNSPICSGGTLNLTANTVAGATYSWTGPGGFTSSLQNPTVTNVTAGGTYTLTITSGTCASTPATVTVVIGPLPTATAGSNSPVCSGGTLNLTANTIAGATYSWTGPGGFTSSLQNPTVTNVTAGGTYTLTITNGGCVSTPSTVTVVVDPLPVATAGSNSPICAGGTLNLTANTIAGATYSWTGPGGFTSNLQNPTVTNVTAGGTYTLTITSGTCASAPATVTVVVDPLPVATAGSNSPVCEGGTLNLTANTIAGATYSWTGPGGFTSSLQNPTVTNVTAGGTYTLTITSGTCASTPSTVTVVVGPLPVATAGSNSPVCSGGTLNLTANTIAGATYSWTGPGGFTSSLQNPTVTNLTAGGTYTLTVTNGGCVSIPSTVTVVVDPLPVATAGSNSPICAGGTLNLTANTIAGATYSWTGPGGFTSSLQNPTVTNVTAGGTYTLTITSGTCASVPATVNVVVDPLHVATAGSNSPVCSGGTLNLTANTIAGATYSWTGPGGFTSSLQNPTVTNVTAGGTYTLTITSGTCASTPATVTVVVDPLPVATAGSNSPVCSGGTLNLTANTIAGATYSWTGPGGFTSSLQNPTVTNLTAGGTYTLTITSGTCASAPSTVTVVVDPLPVATAGSNSPVCEGGTLNLTANTIAGATYSWTGPGGYTSNAQNPTVTNVTAGGTYTLTITSGTCASAPATVTVVVNPTPTVTAGSNSPICAGGTLNLTGNTIAGATYSWTGPGGYTSNVQNPTVTNITAGGTYILTITNTGCASAPSSVTVVVDPVPTATAGSNSPICSGGTLNLTGNTVAGATYSWTGPGGYTSNVQNPSITNVTAGGTYTLIVTTTGCASAPSTVAVVVNPLPTATAGSNSPVCSGGTLNLTANTIAGATYSWTGPGGYTSNVQNPSITNVTAGGTYTLTITSGTCVSVASTVAVVVNPTPTATAGSNSPICSGATLNLTGNTVAGATYSWTGPGGYTSTLQNPSIANVTAGGTYSLVVTTTGCPSAPATVAVVVNPLPTATAGSNSPVCLGNALNLTGNAVAGATYSWTGPNGFTSNLQNPVIATTVAASAGTYTLTITSGTCVSTPSTVTVVVNAPTALAVAGTNVLCNGGSTGMATVTPATPGTYTYTWSPGGGTGATASNLAAGTYSVSAVNALGCVSNATVTITQPTLVALTTSSTQTSCASASGTATVVATGGTGAYTYSWSPSGGTGATASGLTAGVYTVTVKDANNCTKTATATVGSASAPTATTTFVSPTCFGVNDGSATVAVTGGTAPYTYAWSPSGGSAATASNLGGGAYTVTVTDNAGCTAVSTVNVMAPAQPMLTVTGSDANCGSVDGMATAVATGGTGVFTYVWLPGNITGQTANNLMAGTYTVKATDANGCSANGTYTVGINGSLSLMVTPASAVITEGSSVNLNTSVFPNVPGIVYAWTPPAGLSCTNCPNPVATPAQTTTYTLTATSPDGCTGTINTRVNIKLNCGEYFLPNLFSPNGDGMNDEFGVSGKCVTEMYLKVYNRWGQIVFESRDQQSRWDGTFNGERLNSGAFVYAIDIVFADGRQVSDKGSVSIVR